MNIAHYQVAITIMMMSLFNKAPIPILYLHQSRYQLNSSRCTHFSATHATQPNTAGTWERGYSEGTCYKSRALGMRANLRTQWLPELATDGSQGSIWAHFSIRNSENSEEYLQGLQWKNFSKRNDPCLQGRTTPQYLYGLPSLHLFPFY